MALLTQIAEAADASLRAAAAARERRRLRRLRAGADGGAGEEARGGAADAPASGRLSEHLAAAAPAAASGDASGERAAEAAGSAAGSDAASEPSDDNDDNDDDDEDEEGALALPSPGALAAMPTRALAALSAGRARAVRLLDSFEHRGPHGVHFCFVFPPLGPNLLALVRASRYRGLALPAVAEIAAGVLRCLALLHARCEILHTDIKPENILAMPPARLLRRLDKAGEAACAPPSPSHACAAAAAALAPPSG